MKFKTLEKYEEDLIKLMKNSIECMEEGLKKGDRISFEFGCKGVETSLKYFKNTRNK